MLSGIPNIHTTRIGGCTLRPKSPQERALKRFLILFALLFLAIFAACSGSDDAEEVDTVTAAPKDTATTGPTNTPAPPTATPSPRPTATATPNPKPKIGVTTESKGSKYTVNAVELNVVPVGSSKPPAGKRWVAVDVTQEGVTADDSFNSFYFFIQDKADYVYDGTFAFGAGKEPTFNSGKLSPGQKVRGWLIFEVPTDAVVISVLAQPEPIGGTIIIADLTQ